jgi:glyoxylase-like metal-dependent hydrolase (beta-lactamase superfamily II)
MTPDQRIPVPDYPQLRGPLDDGHLVERLGQMGHKPEDIDVVVTTHGHPDHIGGPYDRGNPVFPRARYVFGVTEFDFWKRGENVREARKFNLELFTKLALPLAERSSFIKPGDEVVSGIRAIDVSGHSPGMLAYHIESDNKRSLLWVDTCIHYVIAVQRPDWHLDVDDHKEKAVLTRKRMLEMAASNRVPIAGYHMPFPGIGFIDKSTDGYHWVP